MHLLRTRRGLLLGFVVLALVGGSVRLSFPRVDGHEGDLGGQTLIDGAPSTQHAVCRSSPTSPERVGVVRSWIGSKEEERAVG